jgi:PKD repeat protein
VDGSITTYTWIFGDGNTATGAVVDHVFSHNGSYTVTMVLVDDDGALSYATVKVIVGNQPPVAVARADLGTVLTFEEVEFNGTSSVDPDGNIVSYAWDFGDGFDGTGDVVTHEYSDDGTYQVTLTVTDSAGAYGTNTVSVVVLNRAPVVAFVDLEVVTGEAAIFNGSMCYDPDGYIDTFLWDLGEGLVYASRNATHTWNLPGRYLVTLKIKDDDGATNETMFNVTVLNRQPIARIQASPLQTTLSMPVVFNGSYSTDYDGTVVNWTWSFGDGARGYGEVVEHIYTAYGSYLATLTVRDDQGGVNSTGVLITVRNQPPTADLVVDPSSAYTGEVVTFNASNSSDPENQISQYFWSFGDGASATGAIVTHVYDDDGVYTVRLTVVDEDSATAYGEISITILNRPPKAKAEASPLEVLTLEEVTFTGTGSHDDDGHVLWYRWDFGDGSTSYGGTVVHSFSDDGTYSVILTVTDDDGSEASTTVEVTVGNRAPISIAGPDQTTRTGIPLRLDGRASYDVDGTIVLYKWEFGDGETATGSVVTHAFPTSKSFMVWLEVTDDDGATARSNLTVAVENVKPVARITGTFTVLSGEEVKLDGSSSYDLDGTIVDYLWDLGDGSSDVGRVVQHTYADVGTYIVTLTVEDDGEVTGGLKDTTQVTVTVLNRLPRAVASTTSTKLPTGETLELDGTGSSDPDGKVEVYTWIFGDGSVAYGPRVTHVYDDNGIFMVVLTVADDDGGTDSTSLFIQVENRPPLAAIQGAEEVLTLTHIDFTAEGSLDSDGYIDGYFWDFGDGNGANGWNVSHTFASAGNYTVRLTVIDDDGRTSSTNITVGVVNRPPVAVASVIVSTVVNATVMFDADGSEDLDGIVSALIWEFGDGETDEGREAYHKFTEEGIYRWNLTVVDDRDEKHTVSGSIQVRPKPYVPPPDDTGTDDGKDEGLLPGPSALATMCALAVISLVVAASRRRDKG